MFDILISYFFCQKTCYSFLVITSLSLSILHTLRYDSLGVSQRQLFGYEEDTLLSIILHNILIFLLMIGISPEETLDVCQRLSARTRLATAEEKLLQQTLSELKNAVSITCVCNRMSSMLKHFIIVVVISLSLSL